MEALTNPKSKTGTGKRTLAQLEAPGGQNKKSKDLIVLDRATIMKEALEAQEAGDETKANQLLALLQPNEVDKRLPSNNSQATTTIVASQQPAIKIQENGMAFHKTGVNSFLEMGLPAFFDKNMKELKGTQKKKKKKKKRETGNTPNVIVEELIC
jgi:hypothetical protein